MFIAAVFEPKAAPAAVVPVLDDSDASTWQPELLTWLHGMAERRLEANGLVRSRSRSLQGLKTGVADNAACSTVMTEAATGRRLTLKTSLWIVANRHGGAWLTVMCSVDGEAGSGRFSVSEYVLQRQLSDAACGRSELQPHLREIAEAAGRQSVRLAGRLGELLAA